VSLTNALEAVAADDTEASTVAALAYVGQTPRGLDPGDLAHVIIPYGAESVILDLEGHLPAPRRAKGTVHLHDADSFAAYVNLHKSAATVVYSDALSEQPKLVAVINDDAAQATPGWRDHRAVLAPQLTRAWQRWVGLDGKLLPQQAFAEHIEDGLAEIREPDAASMLELAQTFIANNQVAFRSSRRLDSGETGLRYEETVAATAGTQGEIAIPRTLVLGIPVFEGGDPYKVEARFRYRINNGALLLGYRLNRPEDVLVDAFAHVVDQVEAATQLPALAGIAPAART
jgi:uncharacterized protein YfdQ (DUF2303 family)